MSFSINIRPFSQPYSVSVGQKVPPKTPISNTAFRPLEQLTFGNVPRPVMGHDEKAYYMELQKQAEAKRKTYPLALQLHFPLNGKKASPKQIEATEAQIQQNPVLQGVDLKKLAAFEKAFLPNFSLLSKFLENGDGDVPDEALKVISQLEDPTLKEGLILEFLQSPSFTLRETAVKYLDCIQDSTQQVSILQTMLESQWNSEKKAAAQALLLIHDPAIRDEMIQKHMNHSNRYIREGIADSIHQLSNTTLREDCIKRLVKDREEMVRAALIPNLSTLNNPALLKEILLILEKDNDVSVIRTLLENIPKLQVEPEWLDAILVRRSINPYWQVRVQVAKLIPLMSQQQDKITVIQHLLQDNDSDVRGAAAHVIHCIEDVEIRDSLLQKYANSDSHKVILGVIASIRALANPEPYIPLLEKILKNNNYYNYNYFYVYIKAVETLASIQDEKRLLKIILKHLNNENSPARGKILHALSGITDAETREDIIGQVAELPQLVETISEDLADVIKLVENDSLKVKLIRQLIKNESSYTRQKAAAALTTIKNTTLQNRLIEKFTKSADEFIRLGAAKAVSCINNPQLRDTVIQRLCSDQDSDVRNEALKTVSMIQDTNIKKEIMSKLTLDEDFDAIQHVLKSAVFLVSELNQFKLQPFSYIEFLKETTQKIIPETKLSLFQLTKLLSFYSKMGKDGSELINLLMDYQKVVQHALKHRTEFFNGGSHELSESQLQDYLKENIMPILGGLLLTGRGGVINKFAQKREKFNTFLETVSQIQKDENLFQNLYEVCQFPGQDQQYNFQNYIRLLELAKGFLEMGQIQELSNCIEEMKAKKQADTKLLSRQYISHFAKTCGMKEKEIQGITDEQLDLWNQKHMHLIPTAIEDFSEDDEEHLKALFKASLQGKYTQFINNPRSEIGKANAKTRRYFSKNKLNFDTWMHYPNQEKFRLRNGQELELRLWKRQPGYDLFQGTYAQSCVALDGSNGAAIVDALLYTFVQMLEVVDPKSQETVGKALMYWAKDLNTEKPFIVADNIQAQEEYQEILEIREAITQYMKGFGEAVAGKPVSVMLGSNYNKVPESDLEETDVVFKVLGDTVSHTYYLNSLGTDWEDISEDREGLQVLYKAE